jgi:hypothetical protein
MQRALKKVTAENPGTKQVSVTPSNSAPLTNLMMPKGAMAVTNPFTGNITYNPEAMQGQSPFDMEQTMTHELTHTRQTQDQPWWKTAASLFSFDDKVPQGIPKGSMLDDPYHWRTREMEAFQSERDRAARMKTPFYMDPETGASDIQLPSEAKHKTIDTAPSFMRK